MVKHRGRGELLLELSEGGLGFYMKGVEVELSLVRGAVSWL